MLAAGLTLADLESEAVTYWPDTASAVHLFCRIGTQWRVSGAGGCTGLDYCAIYPLMDRLQLDPFEWDLLLDDIRTLENAALVAMNKND